MLGRPVAIGPIPAVPKGITPAGVTLGIWELSDGWLQIDFDAEERVGARNAFHQGWYDRKRQRVRWATGW